MPYVKFAFSNESIHMAKKRGGTNLSEEIRKYVAANPKAKPKAVSAGLAEAGVKVTPVYVSTILSNERRKSGKRKRRGRKPGRPGTSDAHASLILAKKLADQLGGVNKARAALDTLAKILDS
jgi:hypothetical protein